MMNTAIVDRAPHTQSVRGYEQLLRHVAEHGTARVRWGAQHEGLDLGRWVRDCRRRYREGTLPHEWIERLEALPGWTWNTADTKFDDGYQQLQRYVIEHGTARVAQRAVINGYKLGQWVSRMRTDFRRGRLSPDRIARLQTLPGWTWNAIDSQFDDGYRLLQRYVAEHGTAQVPDRLVLPNGFNLGRWVTNRRADFKAGNLSPERIARLEALPGWVWQAEPYPPAF